MKKKKGKTLNWEEYFAKYLLEYALSNELYNLEVNDKPDLQSNLLNIGIEVTTAIDSKYKEMEGLYVKYGDKPTAIKRIKELGGEVSNYFLSYPVRHKNMDGIYNIFKKKIKLLNSNNYKIFKHNYIFITDTNTINKNEYKEIDIVLNEIQSNYKIKYEKVFIFLYGNILFSFDLENHECNKIIIPYNQVLIVGEKANTVEKRGG